MHSDREDKKFKENSLEHLTGEAPNFLFLSVWGKIP